MNNLEVQDLTIDEMKRTDGGGIVLAVCLTLALLAACSQEAK